MRHIGKYHSPLGEITMAGEGNALTGLWFEGQKYFGSARCGEWEEGMLPVLERTAEWLDLYFEGKIPDFMPEIEFRDTPFRMAVWKRLLDIPYGSKITYGQMAADIAEQMGKRRMSARSIGGAIGHNPISIIVPCHRVVGADGGLTGYAGGIYRKEYLLMLEKKYGCKEGDRYGERA